jgi:hypothetical protein
MLVVNVKLELTGVLWTLLATIGKHLGERHAVRLLDVSMVKSENQ